MGTSGGKKTRQAIALAWRLDASEAAAFPAYMLGGLLAPWLC